jgi:uncharacterized protein (DUF433 family)
MNERIVIDQNILVGKPIIKGTRIPVTLILNLIAGGYNIERIIEAYPILKPEDIQAALNYTEERLNREEIHSLIEQLA